MCTLSNKDKHILAVMLIRAIYHMGDGYIISTVVKTQMSCAHWDIMEFANCECIKVYM